jgi:FSR family fosmidomycin resistance protein-like MFS transporter
MAQITEVSGGAARTNDLRIIPLVCSAHFVSHFYILVLPPLFPFIREFYGVSYTELGYALTAFNVTTALCQTPAGFLVDRVGPRLVLIAGLALGAACLVVVGLVPSFWLLVAMFALMGIANGVYHPADYAILSQLISRARTGQAFSLHIFAGFLGTAVAPASMLLLQRGLGWQGAYLAASVLGLLVALVMLLQPAALFEPAAKPPKKIEVRADADQQGWRLLLSTPILLNLLFFVMITFATTGVQNYSVVALGDAFGTPLGTASTALTVNLLLSAFGVLVGGWIATRVTRHEWVAAFSFAGIAVTAAVIGAADLGLVFLMIMMSLNGFTNGLMQPSRDMIVRAVTPEGQFGKVFGFVTTGFNIGGIIAPFLFGYLMDHGHPQAVFFMVAALSVLAIVTIIPNFVRRRASLERA